MIRRAVAEPSTAELLLAVAAAPSEHQLAERTVSAATQPRAESSRVSDAAEGLSEIVWAGTEPAPETPLNMEIGPHRRFAIVRRSSPDYKRVKDMLGEPSTTWC